MADGDVWYHAITNKRHYPKGRIHHAALKRAVGPPHDAAAGWKTEMSGRLRSIADDIREDGERRARHQKDLFRAKGQSGKEFEFVAVMFAMVGDVRRWEIDRCDVIFDPTDNDQAHANLVFFTNPPDHVLSVLDDVINGFRHCPADEIHMIPAATGGPPACP